MTIEKYSDEQQKSFKKGVAYVTGKEEATVRIFLPDKTETALCTVTYNYSMTPSLRNVIAHRIAELWNESRHHEPHTILTHR